MSFFDELKRRNVIRVAIAYGVAAWFILQLSDVVLENISAPEWVMQTIMLLLVVGFPVTVLFAWIFEMTPEGIKKEKDVDRSQSITSVTGRKLDRMIIGVLTVMVAYLMIDKLILQRDIATPEESTQQAQVEPVVEAGPSVAVLPFINMSGDKENEYFSDGLTETLLHMLAQLPDLRVAARTSSFAFKGQNKSVGEIAAELGVAHILEGSVQKSGERVRITAQLIRADDGFHVWSQNYTRPLDDIFAIQDEIANDVAGALDTSLLKGATQPLRGVETNSLSAYDSYLKGLEQQAIFSYGSLSLAQGHFKQALAGDPAFTDARLALVRNYLLMKGTGLLKGEETLELINPLIAQVREKQPDNRLARGLELLAVILINDDTLAREEWEPIILELRNLLPLLPTETFIRENVAKISHYFFRETQTSLEILEAGLMVDPLDARLYVIRGGIFLDLERNDEALADFHKAQKIAPEHPGVYVRLAEIEKRNNNLTASLEWQRQAIEVDPQDHELAANLAEVFYRLELPEEGDRWHARVTALAPGSAVAKLVEMYRLLARQENQQALALCKSMIAERVDRRGGAFGEALFTYQWLMEKQGKTKEAYDFLLSIDPDIEKFNQMPSDIRGLIMQFSAVTMLGLTEEGRQAWENLTANMDKAGFPWREPDSFSYVANQVFTGEIEGAINSYLEHQLSKPLAANLEILDPRVRDDPLLREVYADPGVKERLTELQDEFVQMREQVKVMMLQPEWDQ